MDRAGLHLLKPVPFLIPWWAVAEIFATKDLLVGNGPEAHVIDIYARQVLPPMKVLMRLGQRKGSRVFGIWNSSVRILRIRPVVDLNLSPEAVLKALDRFRPSTVPIHDPRRVVEDGKT